MIFNENSRVKIPAILHLMRLGYFYIPHNQQIRREDTNIFEDVFVDSLLRINPDTSKEELLRLLDEKSLELDYEDLGRKFYYRLAATSGIKLIDFKNFNNNSFHVTTELTCKNGDEEFRPDITLLVNGMPLAFIEVKKPHNKEGIITERNRFNAREVPEGWEVVELSNIANITMGQPPNGESYNEKEEGIIFYQGSTDFGIRFPSVRQYTTKPTRFAKQGDILLSVRAPVGPLNIAGTDCCIGRGLASINSKSDSICYLYQQIRSLKQVFDRRKVDGTTFGSITKDDLFSLKVIMPNKELLSLYQKTICPPFEKQNSIQKENLQLASLQDWLLPMLMNRQVEFKNDYQEQVQVVSMAAETVAKYKTANKKKDNYRKIQSVYAILWENSLLGVQQGEMATAKDLYLIDRIAQVNTGFTYAQHDWGSFDPAFKITINNKQYFTMRNFPNSRAYYCDIADNGYLLSKIPEEIKEKVKLFIAELHEKIFVNYFGKRKAEMKELYANVLKCIEDMQSTNFLIVRQAMKDWKTSKQDFQDKATKFSEQWTKEALDVIVKEGLDKKIIKMRPISFSYISNRLEK